MNPAPLNRLSAVLITRNAANLIGPCLDSLAFADEVVVVDSASTDGTAELPVSYRGLVPDTFTDQQDIEVIVEGRLGRDGVFQATDVLAKCGSRYESVPTDGERAA